IDELEIMGLGQRAPRVFLRSEIQVHNGPMLRQVEPALAPAHLLKLWLGDFALLEQQVSGFPEGGGSKRVHFTGTSISFFAFNSSRFVCAARLVKVRLCMVA